MQNLYSPINSPNSQNEIRLLKIEPAADVGAQLKCCLSTASLDNSPDYFALSYEWGDAEMKKPIFVNNVSFAVTRNLEAVLRYIRRENEPVTYWIDAVCINQESSEDKNSQLPLMGSIYSRARAVFAYTGHEDDDSRFTFELIRRWTAHLGPSFDSMRDNDWELRDKCEEWFQRKREWFNREELMDDKMFGSAVKFFGRTYWKRAWVQQEMLLGRATMIMAGKSEISFLQMFAFFHAEHRLSRERTQESHRRTLTRPPAISARYALQLSDLNELVHQLRFCQATWLQDKIYAFLGLQCQDDTKVAMDVDYNQPVAHVYAQLVHAMARHKKLFVDGSNGIGFVPRSKRLCPIEDSNGSINPAYVKRDEAMALDSSNVKILDLPSWAPDLTVAEYLPVPRERDPPGPYGAARDTEPEMQISNDWRKLTSKGVVFDCVDSVSIVGDLGSSNNYNRMQLLGKILTTLRGEHPTGIPSLQACFRSVFPFPPGTDKNLENHAIAFIAALGIYHRRVSQGTRWRWSFFIAEFAPAWSQTHSRVLESLAADGRDESLIPPREARVAFFAANNYLPGLPNKQLNPETFQNIADHFWIVFRSLSYKTMFTTEKHYIGHGPQGLMRGDRICVLLGCDRPLAIRPTKGSDMYEVVGPVMMYGVLDGEIIQQARDGKLEYATLSFR